MHQALGRSLFLGFWVAFVTSACSGDGAFDDDGCPGGECQSGGAGGFFGPGTVGGGVFSTADGGTSSSGGFPFPRDAGRGNVPCSEGKTTCESGFFCEFPSTSCGLVGSTQSKPAATASGVCVPRAQECVAISAPVCGCDGKTYDNDCQRRAAGASKAAEGDCAKAFVIVGEGAACGKIDTKPTAICGTGLFCESPAKECASSNVRGTCQTTPQQCLATRAPVCACDGKTYENDCQRRQAGQSLAHTGGCSVSVAKVGEPCGPTMKVNCDEASFCDPQPDQCTALAFVGTCQPRVSGACTKELVPVCGCDGRNYDNDCLRVTAGVAKARQGECQQDANLLPRGVWGGPRVELAANDPAAGGSFKFDCGKADITEPLALDSGGHFSWKARYTFQGGLAPTPVQNPPQDAVVVGFISSDRMSLNFRVQITGIMTPPSMFSVQLGTPATPGSCL